MPPNTPPTFSDEVVKAYIESDGSHCPHCKSDNIETIDRDMPVMMVRCNDCRKVWKETYKLVALNDQFIPPSLPEVVVFVEGGCVTQVVGFDGQEYPCQSVVDYDNEGMCPVCGFEIGEEKVCIECGYDQNACNALECVIALKKNQNEDKLT